MQNYMKKLVMTKKLFGILILILFSVAAISASAKTINFGGAGDFASFTSYIGIGDSNPNALLSINGSGSTPLLTFARLASLSTDTGREIILRNLDELRFTDSNDWDYNSWGGIKYDKTAKELVIGGPSDGEFKAGGGAASSINIIFSGIQNIGVGTTSPVAKLTVGGRGGTDGIMFPDGTLQTTAFSVGGSWQIPANKVSSGGFGGLTGGGDYTFPRDLGVAGNIGLSGSLSQIALSASAIISEAMDGSMAFNASEFNFNTGDLEVVDGSYKWRGLTGTSVSVNGVMVS